MDTGNRLGVARGAPVEIARGKNTWSKFRSHNNQNANVREFPNRFGVFTDVDKLPNHNRKSSDFATAIPSEVHRRINRMSTSRIRPRDRADRRSKVGPEEEEVVSVEEGLAGAGEPSTSEASGHDLGTDLPEAEGVAYGGRKVWDQFSAAEGRKTKESRRRTKEDTRNLRKSDHEQGEIILKSTEENTYRGTTSHQPKDKLWEKLNDKNLEGEHRKEKKGFQKNSDNHATRKEGTRYVEDNVAPKAKNKSEINRKWKGHVNTSKVEDGTSVDEEDVILAGTRETVKEKMIEHLHFEKAEDSENIYKAYGTDGWKEVTKIGVFVPSTRVTSSTDSPVVPDPRLYTVTMAETALALTTSKSFSLWLTKAEEGERPSASPDQSATSAQNEDNEAVEARIRATEEGKITNIDVFHHRHFHDLVSTKSPSTLAAKMQEVTTRSNLTSKDFQTMIAEITHKEQGSVKVRNQEENETLEKVFDGENVYIEENNSGDASEDGLGEIPLANGSSGGRTPSTVPLLDTEGTVRIPCYVVIFLLGVVGNSLVIVTLLQNRKMRTITNVFLLNLAISDLLLGVFCMPVTLVGSLLRDFIFGAVMCRLIPYFQAVSISVSVWTLVAISLERYYAICQPLRSRGWQTLSHAYKIISIVWLLSLVAMAPIAALSKLLPIGSTNRHKCREMWPSLHLERGFTLFLGLGLLLVPLVIMVAAYPSITVSLWHGMRLERETGQVISLTDLNGLAMVQQSLRRKQSKRHVSKISIRFRKIPSAVTRTCEHCGKPKAYTPEPSTSHHDSVPTVNHAHSEASPIHAQDPHYCYHDLGERSHYHNSKWHVESVTENGRYHPRTPKKKKKQHDFKRLRSTHLEKSIEAKKHVIRMLFVVVLEFFLCWTPIFVVNILCLYIPEQVYRALGSFGISFLHLLSYASSCCNPITYCFMNKKFLQGFRHAFGCRKDTERQIRQNGTGASFRSQSNNALRLVGELKRDGRETTV
ncbi:putative cholecystokinin receptor-like [Penaeus vannamei]|uniref:Gastrin/cholecystokinin type B receptor n=1 Tax=Penaeus vannamei TaxID=6689 RepID=A0A423THH4_PENVA|nr:putative cholecystokinin receptor-like [Penaeus vannamei]